MLASSAKRPEKTNLCRFFWRVVFSLLVAWPFTLIALCGVLGVGFSVAFLFGRRLAIFASDKKGAFVIPYERWPSVFGRRILPIYFLAGWLAYLLVPPMVHFVIASSTIPRVIGACVALAVLMYAMIKTGLARLTWEFARAKKNKHCPIVEFK